MIELTDNSKVINFSYLDKDFDDSGLYLPKGFENLRNDIIFVGGKYYHIKMSNKWILNELIGSFLAKKIGLDVVDYKIGLCYGDKYALSEVFFERGYSYFEPIQLGFNLKLDGDRSLIDRIRRIDKNMFDALDMSMIEKVLKLTSVDLKTGQFDRDNPGNTIIKCKDGIFDLAPVFDFDSSYEEDEGCYNPYFYGNPFLIVGKDRVGLSKLISYCPSFYDSICVLRDTPMEEILCSIEKDNDIVVPGTIKRKYERLDKEYTKVLKKV